MPVVTINTSICYDVLIEKGCLAQSGALCAQVFEPKHSRAAIITDDTVASLYLNKVKASLEQAGFSTASMSFPHGEDSKSHDTLFRVYDFLIENQFTRSDFIVALGGGVVGDLSGFAAATYLRGIPFVQIPTTFLAAIDSSVGGKTAVNISAGKNLIGAFHQPSLVICDPEVFSTLTPEIFADGCAEMIKYAMLESEDFLQLLETCDISQHIEDITARCVENKRRIVEEDEHDKGIRMVLNYGHTLGHAIEKVTNHKISHGQGVAMGMDAITKLGIHLGICDKNLLSRLDMLLKKYHLPQEYQGNFGALVETCLQDKKRAGSKIRLIFVAEAGKPQILPMDVEEFSALIREVFPC